MGIVILGEDRSVSEGDEVRRTKRIVQVPVGPTLLGRVVDVLGRPLDGLGPVEAQQFSELERIAPGIINGSLYQNLYKRVGKLLML